ncbi:class I SAM-dependent methyltransferase [Pyrobaculum sp.]|uniref:class I SAM-dependent methyltransferase n=1 Tax=Pyrobaculum sp. TaxID=2004705 RepID=UPI003D106DB1
MGRPLVAFDIDGTLEGFGGVFGRREISLLKRYAEVAVVSARGDCVAIASSFGIQRACCAGLHEPSKEACMRRLASELSPTASLYIADLPSDFEQATKAGWNWADANHLKVNLGCGADIRTGYVNVDLRALPGVNVVMDILDEWPFPYSSLEEVLAIDVVEHVPWRAQLLLWRRLAQHVKPGGRVVVRTPDIELIYEKVVKRRDRNYGGHGFKMLYEAFSFWIGGGQDYPGNFHYTFFTRNALSELASAYGFTAECADDGGINMICTLVASRQQT